MQVIGGMNRQKQYGSKRVKSALYGVYNVDHFIMDGDSLPPLLTDQVRWKRILFDYPSYFSVVMMDDKVKRYNSDIDTLAQTIKFSEMRDTTNKYEFSYTLSEKDLQLEGVFKGDSLIVELEHYDIKNFALLNRGFHWVNEVPFNRYNYDY